MHEMSLVSESLRIINQSLASYPGVRLRRVVFKIGTLANVLPDCLSFCFQILAQGTPLANAQLLLEEIPGSREIFVDRLEVDEEDPSDGN